MYDLHCHILYGTDDGAESMEMALRMIELAAEKGTKGIVATPHTNVPGSYENFWSESLRSKFIELRTQVKEKNIDIKIFCGQEIFCTHRTLQLLKSGELITINNSKYPLVEFDFEEYSETVYSQLEELVSYGYIPVIAHPERYAFVSEDDRAIKQLKNIGCLLQLNKGSIEGKFGGQAYTAAHKILEMRLADVVASDAHSPYMRTPAMAHTHELISEEYSYDYADVLFSLNPIKILQNTETVSY